MPPRKADMRARSVGMWKPRTATSRATARETRPATWARALRPSSMMKKASKGRAETRALRARLPPTASVTAV